MHAEEGVVDHGGERESVERFEGCLVDRVGVFPTTCRKGQARLAVPLLPSNPNPAQKRRTFKTKGEVVRQPTTFVVPSQQQKICGIVDFERVEEQQALPGVGYSVSNTKGGVAPTYLYTEDPSIDIVT